MAGAVAGEPAARARVGRRPRSGVAAHGAKQRARTACVPRSPLEPQAASRTIRFGHATPL